MKDFRFIDLFCGGELGRVSDPADGRKGRAEKMKSKWKVGDWSPGNLCVIKWTALPEPPFFAAEYRKVADVYNQADVPIIAAAPEMFNKLAGLENALRPDIPRLADDIAEVLRKARGLE